jgi:hypothetical protein
MAQLNPGNQEADERALLKCCRASWLMARRAGILMAIAKDATRVA